VPTGFDRLSAPLRGGFSERLTGRQARRDRAADALARKSGLAPTSRTADTRIFREIRSHRLQSTV